MLNYLNIHLIDSNSEIFSDILFYHLHRLYVLALCYGRSTNKIMNLSLVFFRGFDRLQVSGKASYMIACLIMCE